MEVKITERGWPGHYICAHACEFRRNTLVECTETGKALVVSTVGRYRVPSEDKSHYVFEQIGSHNRMFETMVFEADDSVYRDAVIRRQIDFDGVKRGLCNTVEELAAQEMHEANVKAAKEWVMR